VFALIWLGGPAVGAALLTIVTKVRWARAYIVFGIGVGLAVAFVLAAYLQAPPDYQHSQGDEDGRMFLGRWWEPQFVAFLAVIAYLFWALGVGAGFLIRFAFDLFGDRGRKA
jgi:hypothetical protein